MYAKRKSSKWFTVVQVAIPMGCIGLGAFSTYKGVEKSMNPTQKEFQDEEAFKKWEEKTKEHYRICIRKAKQLKEERERLNMESEKTE